VTNRVRQSSHRILPAVLFSVLLAAGRGRAEELKVPITRDLWVSSVGDEKDGNNGGSHGIKLKSIQEMTLIDFDPAPLKGRTIRAVTLHLKKRGDEILHRLTASTVAGGWVEGTGNGYAKEFGASTFRHRRHPTEAWAGPDGDLTSVVLGNGGTIWRMADAFPPDAEGWQRVAIDPLIIAARLAGVSDGILLFDDTGSEWTRDGEKFTYRLFPNRFFMSRDGGRSGAPWLAITTGDPDDQPPTACSGITTSITGLPGGEALVRWMTPADNGPAGTIGFMVRLGQQSVPRWMIPAAGEPGQTVEMHLRDLALIPGSRHSLRIQAVDGAGNIGPAVETTIAVSDFRPQALPTSSIAQVKPDPAGPLPKLGGCEVAVIDTLDKVHPVSGAFIPPQSPEYLRANHLWNAKGRTIHLHAARGEIVNFQVLLKGQTTAPVVPSLTGLEPLGPGLRISFAELRSVPTDAGPMPDALVPVRQGLRIPSPDNRTDGQTHGSLVVELVIPTGAPSGTQRGTLILTAGPESLALPLTLTIRPFALPDELTFLAEMNCYGVPGGSRDVNLERSYYQLAHYHRTTLNHVSYSHNGRVEDGCAPVWNGRDLDWSQWDERFQPLLNGTAFQDLPRSGIPVECFYLPLHENWPTPMEGHYNGDYWADRAFSEKHRRDFARVTALFQQHFAERGWNRTLFLGYLNNKVDYKRNGWSRATSPWLLDEPANWQDYIALKHFGELFQEGVQAATAQQSATSARLLFRADISRPEWQRESFDQILDYNVVSSGAYRQYHRLVTDRQRRTGHLVVVYGSTNHPARSNVQPAAWCWESWLGGADGVLPWQTVGTSASWKKGEDTCVFYPGEPAGQTGPVPSVRLKAYLRGQQDAEYLTQLTDALALSRNQMAATLRHTMQSLEIHLKGQRQSTGFTGGEDAGVVDFGALKPGDLWRLRMTAADAIEQASTGKSAMTGSSSTSAIIRRVLPPRDLSISRQSRTARGPQPPATPRWTLLKDE